MPQVSKVLLKNGDVKIIFRNLQREPFKCFVKEQLKNQPRGRRGKKTNAVEDFINNPKCTFVANIAFMYFNEMI